MRRLVLSERLRDSPEEEFLVAAGDAGASAVLDGAKDAYVLTFDDEESAEKFRDEDLRGIDLKIWRDQREDGDRFVIEVDRQVAREAFTPEPDDYAAESLEERGRGGHYRGPLVIFRFGDKESFEAALGLAGEIGLTMDEEPEDLEIVVPKGGGDRETLDEFYKLLDRRRIYYDERTIGPPDEPEERRDPTERAEASALGPEVERAARAIKAAADGVARGTSKEFALPHAQNIATNLAAVAAELDAPEAEKALAAAGKALEKSSPGWMRGEDRVAEHLRGFNEELGGIAGALGERDDGRVASGLTHRPDIVDAMAKYAYASAWADAYEEAGGRFPPGTKIEKVAPPPTPEAKKWAEETAKDIERMNKASLDYLLSKAMDADGTPGQEAKWVGEFAYGIAMPSLGHGVHWFDRHTEFPLELPHNDFIVYPDEPEVVAALEKDTTEARTATKELSPEERIAKFREIVGRHQHAKIDGAGIDAFSASAVVQVYDALSDANKARYAAMPAAKMVNMAYKMMAKGRGEASVVEVPPSADEAFFVMDVETDGLGERAPAAKEKAFGGWEALAKITAYWNATVEIPFGARPGEPYKVVFRRAEDAAPFIDALKRIGVGAEEKFSTMVGPSGKMVAVPREQADAKAREVAALRPARA